MRVIKWYWFLCFFLLGNIIQLSAQEGCTDPQAENYSPAAAENDGSCTYSETNYNPLCISIFPEEIKECSGLEFFDNQLYAINDSGDGTVVYQIDSTNARVIRRIWIGNTTNVDWEELTSDEDYLYIGDFGNNFGTRRDLKIIKVPKNELLRDTTTSEEITFRYADQTDFTPRSRDNDHDCEAFFAYKDRLYLFSKNWVDGKTRMYFLPKTPGDYTLTPQAEFDVNGQITAADISVDGKNILLLGYTETANIFMWLLFDYQEFMPFSGNKRRIKLGTFLSRSQTEALTFQDTTEGFIGGENVSFVRGKLSHFKISEWIENPKIATNDLKPEDQLHLFPNPFKDELLVDAKTNDLNIRRIELYTIDGKRVKRKRKNLRKRIRIDGSNLTKGFYILKIYTKKNGVIVRKVVKA